MGLKDLPAEPAVALGSAHDPNRASHIQRRRVSHRPHTKSRSQVGQKDSVGESRVIVVDRCRSVVAKVMES